MLLAEIANDAPLSFGWLFVKMLVAMAVVLALAVYFIRYVLPKLQMVRKVGGSGRIKIIERYPLEPRKQLYVIRVGNKAALIGSSDQGLSKLMDLEEGDVSSTDKK